MGRRKRKIKTRQRCYHDIKSLLEDFNDSRCIVYDMCDIIGDYKSFKSAAESVRNAIRKYGYKNMKVTQSEKKRTIYIIKVK